MSKILIHLRYSAPCILNYFNHKNSLCLKSLFNLTQSDLVKITNTDYHPFLYLIFHANACYFLATPGRLEL